MTVVAKNTRFIIREFLLHEENLFVELFTDSRLTQYLPKRSLDETHQLFKDILHEYNDGTGLNRWAIMDGNNVLMGFGMLRHDTEPGKAELGYAIHYQFWNRGLATEVSKALVTYGFAQKHLSEIFAVTDHDNIPSQRVLEKAGLKRSGILSRKGIELAFFNVKAEDL